MSNAEQTPYGALCNALKAFAGHLFKQLCRQNQTNAETRTPLGCPACGGTKFQGGPRGGMSVNVVCVGCNREWNYVPYLANFDLSRVFQPIKGNTWPD